MMHHDTTIKHGNCGISDVVGEKQPVEELQDDKSTSVLLVAPHDAAKSIDASSVESLSVPTFDELRCEFSPMLSLYGLTNVMARSQETQEMLQEWDVKNGLPRSHCCTMMHTNRSRRQLLQGQILPKWNGAPLIGDCKTPDTNTRRTDSVGVKTSSTNRKRSHST